jgi:hypothetical protein
MKVRQCTHQADGFGDAVTFCTTTAVVEPAVETTAPGAGAGILLLEVAATVRPAAAWPPAHRPSTLQSPSIRRSPHFTGACHTRTMNADERRLHSWQYKITKHAPEVMLDLG